MSGKGKPLANFKKRIKLNWLVRKKGGFFNQSVFHNATGKFLVRPCFMEAEIWEELILAKE